MFKIQHSKILKEGEQLIRVVERDVLASLLPLIFAAVLVAGDFFLLAFFLRAGIWGVAAFFILLVVALIVALRSLVEWRLNSLILTSERIIHIHQKGFFTRTISETTFDKVTDVRSEVRGFLQTALSLGAVEIQTAGEKENLRLEGVRHPSQVQTFLTSLLRDTQKTQPLNAQELVKALQQVQAGSFTGSGKKSSK